MGLSIHYVIKIYYDEVKFCHVTCNSREVLDTCSVDASIELSHYFKKEIESTFTLYFKMTYGYENKIK